MYEDDELYHHGILGQKWGVRRYQNKDGSLTPLGKKKYGTKTNFEKVQSAKRSAKRAKEAKARAAANRRTAKEIAKYKFKNENEARKKASTKPAAKSISDMTDDELKARIERLKLEKSLKDLTPQQVQRGKKFVDAMGDLAIDIGKDAAKKYADKMIKDALGIKPDEMELLEKEAKKADFRKRIRISEDHINKSDKERNATTDSELDDLEKRLNKAKKQKELYETEEALKKYEQSETQSTPTSDYDDLGRAYTQLLLEDRRRRS